MTECKRFMHVDTLINGQPAVLDWRTQAVIPRKDAADPFDPTVWIAEDYPASPKSPKEPFEIVLPGGNVTPGEALERSRKIIRRLKGIGEPIKLTVGDLSVVSAEEKKRKKAWIERRVNRSDVVSVGDLSVVPDASKGLQDLFVGADLVPKPCTSPSQEMQMAMQRKQRKKREEIFELQQIMVGQALEKEGRRLARREGL